MFNKSKNGGGFKGGKLASGVADKKEILEGLGYVFDSVTKKSGWSWTNSAAHSDVNLPTEADVIDDAWGDDGERTQAAMNIPVDTWERMNVKEQAELIEEALSTR